MHCKLCTLMKGQSVFSQSMHSLGDSRQAPAGCRSASLSQSLLPPGAQLGFDCLPEQHEKHEDTAFELDLIHILKPKILQ